MCYACGHKLVEDEAPAEEGEAPPEEGEEAPPEGDEAPQEEGGDEEIPCPACGTMLSANAIMCYACGHRLEEGGEEEGDESSDDEDKPKKVALKKVKKKRVV